MIFCLIRSQSIILFWNSDPRFVLRHIFGTAWYRLSVASWIVGLASIGLASDPQNRGTPRDCRLMINWDQFNMTALPLTYVHLDADPEPEKVKALIEEIVDEHAKAKIDRIVECVFSMSKGTVPPEFKSFYREHIPDNIYKGRPTGYWQLENAGYNRIQIALDRAHQQGMEYLGGLRMNDRHQQSSAFHKAHPEWQLPEFPGGMDYQYRGVRESVLDFAAEFLERFDVDGLELDWMRWCHVFQPSEAKQNAPLLTEFVGQCRTLLDNAALKRGRQRLLLGVRVPQTMEECQTLGFDIAAWVRSGAVDFVCPSDFFHTDFNIRTEDFVELVQGTNCRVYPSIHPMISRGNEHHCHTLESYRAAAHNYYAFGADGISVYNYQYHWREDMGSVDAWPRALTSLASLRDPQEVAAGQRHYLFHPLWPGPATAKLGTCPTGVDKNMQMKLDRQTRVLTGTLPFRIAEECADANLLVTLKFKASGMAIGDELELSLNGSPISPTQIRRVFDEDGQTAQEGRVLPPFFVYQIPLSSPPAKFGDNSFSVSLNTNPTAADSVVTVQELEVSVTSRRPSSR